MKYTVDSHAPHTSLQVEAECVKQAWEAARQFSDNHYVRVTLDAAGKATATVVKRDYR